MKTILAKDMNQNKSSIHMTLEKSKRQCVRSDFKNHRTLPKNLNYSTSLKIKAQQSSLPPSPPPKYGLIKWQNNTRIRKQTILNKAETGNTNLNLEELS